MPSLRHVRTVRGDTRSCAATSSVVRQAPASASFTVATLPARAGATLPAVRLFRRSDAGLEPDDPHAAIVAAVDQVTGRRAGGPPIILDELPVVVGLANLHANTVAALRLEAVDASTGERRSVQPPIVTRPDPGEPVGDTLHKLTQSLYWSGNAWALLSWEPGARPEDGIGAAVAMRVVNPNTVQLVAEPDDPLAVRAWEIDGYRYDPTDVFHVKINDDPRNGPLGRSPLQQARWALEWYGWALWHLAAYYAQGGNPAAVLKSTRRLTATRAADVSGEWVAARQARRPAVMGPDWSLDVPPAADMGGTVEALAEACAEVCRALNVPPSLGNAPSSSSLTYSNTAEELRRWLALGLRPGWLAPLERAWSYLLPRGTDASFVDADLYRSPAAAGMGLELTPEPETAPDAVA